MSSLVGIVEGRAVITSIRTSGSVIPAIARACGFAQPWWRGGGRGGSDLFVHRFTGTGEYEAGFGEVEGMGGGCVLTLRYHVRPQGRASIPATTTTAFPTTSASRWQYADGPLQAAATLDRGVIQEGM